MKKKLLLIGGGGHCHSVIDSILSAGEYEELGIVDCAVDGYLDVPVVGNDGDIPRLIREGWTEGFITVGCIGDVKKRKSLYQMAKLFGLSVPCIIDPTAVIAKQVLLGEGVYIGKRAVINTGSSVGECSIVNTGSIIEHDCGIGSFVHLSPGSVLCGQVEVGDDSHIGAGSVIKQMIKVGKGALIGAGSVVVSDIPANVKAYGNPCRVVE